MGLRLKINVDGAIEVIHGEETLVITFQRCGHQQVHVGFEGPRSFDIRRIKPGMRDLPSSAPSPDVM